VLYRLVMEPFEFVSQMQNAALEVSYHQVIRRRTGQSLSGLLFESFVPPFKISNMIRFRHGSLRNYASVRKRRAGALRECPMIIWCVHLREGARSFAWKSRSPSSNSLLQEFEFQNGNGQMSLT
jgi:hypothetical protein